MKIQAEESSSFPKPKIREGLHHAELVDISPAPDGKYGPRIALDFNVYPSTIEHPAKIGRILGRKLTPKAKLWEGLEALVADLKLGEEYDTNKVLGNPCRVMVEDYTDSEGKKVSGITKIKPAAVETKKFIEQAKLLATNLPQSTQTGNISTERVA